MSEKSEFKKYQTKNHFFVLQRTGKGHIEPGTRNANGKCPYLPDLHERVFKAAHQHSKNFGT